MSHRIRLISSNETALQGMGDRFKTVVGPQLLVDVMEVITQSLRTDSKRLGDPAEHRFPPRTFVGFQAPAKTAQ